MGLAGDSVLGVVRGDRFALYTFLFTWGVCICPALIRRMAKTWLTIELKKRREKVKRETWNGSQRERVGPREWGDSWATSCFGWLLSRSLEITRNEVCPFLVYLVPGYERPVRCNFREMSWRINLSCSSLLILCRCHADLACAPWWWIPHVALLFFFDFYRTRLARRTL